jgi:transcriptional regulator with GAF, ATPase, and Fis domain
MTESDDLATALSGLARSLEDEDTVESTLRGIVHAAVGTIPGAEHAGILTVERRREVRTSAATDEFVARVDEAQRETAQGPCMDALFEDRTVRVPEIATEERWPEFVPRAAELGVASMLSIQLYVADDNLGALNLYARHPHAFDEGSEFVGQLFGTHAAVAMSAAQKQDQLAQGMATRDLIGQAKGILMERHRITGDQAFALLVGASQRTNIKLRDVAERLVHSGELVDRQRRRS